MPTPVALGAELLAGFPGALREAGMAVDPERAATFLTALKTVPLCSLADLSRAGRVTLGRIGRNLVLLPTLEVRKFVPFVRGPLIDVARTARAARRTAGETLRLYRKIRPERPRRMLLLVDVSGSMKAHSETTLRFAHLLARARPKVEIFCFGTRLSRVTKTLRHRLPDEALARLSDLVFDFDGGTRIGASLEEFLSVSRHAALVRGAVTLVFSDGLERGDPQQMIHAVGRLARLSHRLIWVSPLAGDPNYRPLTRAMAGILSTLDAVIDGSDFPALERVVKALPAVENGPRGEAWRRFAERHRDSLLFSARANLEPAPPFCGKK